MEIAAWLRDLGLERYVPDFRDNEIDWEVLPKLTSEDLREIGVAAIGHRRKLLDAIAALGATVPTAAVTAAPSDAPAPTDAERRQLTVMFCDLVGSTLLSGRYDPEDLREIVGAYQRCVADTVARFAGFVAKYMGDGVLVYFGYPEAHEDDAERAVRAGLAVIDTVGGLATPEPLNVRLGVASGLVVAGDLIGAGAAQERGVVGETPNLAARLQGLAQPGALVIAESTRRQLGTLFEIEDLGPQSLAGFAEPQGSWRPAEALTLRGSHEAALAAVKDGQTAQEETGQRTWEAELYRLEGVALFGLNRLDEGQAAFGEALRIARQQQAKSYELRAASSLARLWGEQGRRAEARDLLAPVYGWFTEGFDTAALKDAAALLDQ